MSDEKKIFAKPAEGRTVPHADGRTWAAEGDWVDLNDRYYRRRLSDGDIVKTDPPVNVAAAPAPDEAAAFAAEVAATTEVGDDEASASSRRKSR